MPKQLFPVVLVSRLGLKFISNGQKAANIGVENGGKAILKEISKINLQTAAPLIFTFPVVESLSEENYLVELIQLFNQTKQELQAKWQDNQVLVALGGGHGTAYISLSTVLARYGNSNVGVVVFDSHGDLHLPQTSPSGNFHGMWLRTFFPGFPDVGLENQKIKPNQLCFVGNLVLENEEKNFLLAKRIPVYSGSEISLSSAKELTRWAGSFAHLHISFDIDVFAQSLVKSTGTPNPNGLTQEPIFMMLRALNTHPSVSLDIMEFNPQKPGVKRSLGLINQVFKIIFS